MKWYDVQEQIGGQTTKVMPIFEDAESGVSVDVLVFGYFTDHCHTPSFGIGYTTRNGVWIVATSNGQFAQDIDGNDFVPLKWAYLPDEPAEIPPADGVVKNIGQITEISPHCVAAKSPDVVTSLNTHYGPDWIPHCNAE